MRPLSLLLGFISCLLLSSCEAKDPSVRGKIELSVELQRTIRPTAALYVIARRPGTLTGPPLAVLRFGQPLLFPVDYKITEKLEGNLTIMARLSQSGAAIPVRPGDIEGFSKESYVPAGAKDVDIELKEVRKEAQKD